MKKKKKQWRPSLKKYHRYLVTILSFDNKILTKNT